jgi:hypothetical protein
MLVSMLVQGHPINRSRTVFPDMGERMQNRKRTGGENLLKAPQGPSKPQRVLLRPLGPQEHAGISNRFLVGQFGEKVKEWVEALSGLPNTGSLSL